MKSYLGSYWWSWMDANITVPQTGKVTYFHSAILPAIVHPEKEQVISLAPEFICPQDGHKRQDCEIEAAKRWVTNNASLVDGQGITLLGDDIYSHQPMIVNALMHNLIFIFVCLPQSHGALEEWLTFLDKTGEIKTFEHKRYLNGQGEIWSYRYVPDPCTKREASPDGQLV